MFHAVVAHLSFHNPGRSMQVALRLDSSTKSCWLRSGISVIGATVDIRPVDPRDVRWEDMNPVFRATIWSRGSDDPNTMWSSDEYEVRDADVAQVISWAEAKKPQGRAVVVTVDVLVRRNVPSSPGVIRLIGIDPTEPS